MKKLKTPAQRPRKAPSNQTGGTAWGKKLAAEFSRMVQAADMKRLILLNFPYIIAFYMMEKAAWLYRHCNGNSVVDRLMVLFMNFGLAYKSVLPSFHPFDLMVGLVGAAALKAVIYFKGKNAKKYRQGEEYGSARWGNQKDIEPFIDPVFENNVILTQTERLMMSGRPKHPKYARNKNVIVIGGSGSGKTRFYVKPNLMQMPQKVSYVLTDPKGQQYITEGTHEAIVSREEFEKAQLVIKSNSHKVLMGSVDFPLKGKVRCGNCRRVMAHNFKQAVPTFWCREGLELVGQTQCTSEIFQVSDIENAVFQALKKELSLLDALYGDIQKEEQDLKDAHKKANRHKTLMEQELKKLKGEKMRMYEEYAAGTLLLDTYKQKKQECDRRISEVQEQIEQSKAEESTQSLVPGTVRAAAEQAENFLNGTRLTASMVSAFVENVFVYGGGRIVVRFKYEQSIQDAARALHKS